MAAKTKEEANPLLTNTACASSFESEVKKEMQERIVKNFLDQIIMSAIANTTCIKATHILSILKIYYDIELSPGTLYSLFDALERKGMIKKYPTGT